MTVFKNQCQAFLKNSGKRADIAIAKANINCNETEQ